MSILLNQPPEQIIEDVEDPATIFQFAYNSADSESDTGAKHPVHQFCAYSCIVNSFNSIFSALRVHVGALVQQHLDNLLVSFSQRSPGSRLSKRAGRRPGQQIFMNGVARTPVSDGVRIPSLMGIIASGVW